MLYSIIKGNWWCESCQKSIRVRAKLCAIRGDSRPLILSKNRSASEL